MKKRVCKVKVGIYNNICTNHIACGWRSWLNIARLSAACRSSMASNCCKIAAVLASPPFSSDVIVLPSDVGLSCTCSSPDVTSPSSDSSSDSPSSLSIASASDSTALNSLSGMSDTLANSCSYIPSSHPAIQRNICDRVSRWWRVNSSFLLPSPSSPRPCFPFATSPLSSATGTSSSASNPSPSWGTPSSTLDSIGRIRSASWRI
mmetsp:Transcript_13491/g.35459  ORF Transcript_13491/g.35459 Transcript_13491/m.35459 type:complete len:205 (+) Transcript_13491:109-723(+)